MNTFLNNLRTAFEPGWMMRARQKSRVTPRQAHRISDLALELAMEIAPGITPERRGSSPMEIAATDLANYLHGGWEFPWIDEIVPPPTGWDTGHARTMLDTAMHSFESDSITSPRDPANELKIRRMGYDLAMAILDVSCRKDREGLLDRVVHGEIGQVPRPDERQPVRAKQARAQCARSPTGKSAQLPLTANTQAHRGDNMALPPAPAGGETAMESRQAEPQEEGNRRVSRSWEYVQRHGEMARIGLAIGTGLAVPFLVATGIAATRGDGAEAAAWLISAVLMLVTMPSLAIWSSRRD